MYFKTLLNTFLLCFKNQSYLITRISRITEQTTLFRSCYVLLPLYKFKLFSTYSTNSLFNQKYFCLLLQSVSSWENNSLFNFERERLCFQAFCMHINIHFGPLCQDNTITWRSIISARQDSLDLSCEKHHVWQGRDNFYM